MALLTLTQQQEIKAIDYNYATAFVGGDDVNNITNFDQLNSETEESDLADLLGDALLQDLQENPTEANNLILLDGGSFTDCDDNLIKFKGVRYVLAYLNYVNHVEQSYANDTATGIVKKNNEESTFLNVGERKDLAAKNNGRALRDFEKIKKYLDENSETYTLWIKSKSKNISLPNFTSVRSTINK